MPVYAVDRQGKVYKFCTATGWSNTPDSWCVIKERDKEVGSVYQADYVGWCHPNEVVQTRSPELHITSVLQNAVRIVERQESLTWSQTGLLVRIKRALRAFDARSREW